MSDNQHQNNIVLKEVQFKKFNDDGLLDQLDEEIKQTEHNIMQMNQRFEELQQRSSQRSTSQSPLSQHRRANSGSSN